MVLETADKVEAAIVEDDDELLAVVVGFRVDVDVFVTVVDVEEEVVGGGGCIVIGRVVVTRGMFIVDGAEVVVVGGLFCCSPAVITFDVVVIGLVGLK